MPLQRFRVLHISDLHLAQRPNMVGWQCAVKSRLMLARVFRQHKQAGLPITSFTGSYDELVGNDLLRAIESELSGSRTDALLITGDIATVGTKADIGAAINWLSGDNGANIALPAGKILSMPGNHDRFFGKLPLFSGSKRFEHEQAFGPRWNQTRDIAPRPEPVREYRLQSPHAKSGLSIICADFSLSFRGSVTRPGPHFDEGVVDDDTLDALCAATSFAKDEGQAVMWAIHFPPNFPGEIRKKLRGYRRLLSAAYQYGVHHILSGHTHKQLVYQTGSEKAPINVYCAGTAMCDGAREHAFFAHTIICLDGEVKDVATETFEYSKGSPKRGSQSGWSAGMASAGSYRPVRLQWLSRFGF